MESLLVLALIAGLVYFVFAVVFSDLTCLVCGGKGKFRNPIGRGTRPCPRCKGKSRKKRLSRKVWDRMRGQR